MSSTTSDSPTPGEPEPTAAEQRRCCENWQAVRERVATACHQAGRGPDTVRIVGVTKYVGLAATRALIEAGCRDLGESRPQALWEKAAAFATGDRFLQWHLIGHLQRNKVPRTVACGALIQTLDSERLAIALNQAAVAAGVSCEVLLEVNVSADPGRSGVVPAAAGDLLEIVAGLPGLRPRGVMGMASHPDAGIDPRQEFAHLRTLRDTLAEQCPAAGDLPELSMGMSGDFEAAILEGSTMVRIGSALFEGLR